VWVFLEMIALSSERFVLGAPLLARFVALPPSDSCRWDQRGTSDFPVILKAFSPLRRILSFSLFSGLSLFALASSSSLPPREDEGLTLPCPPVAPFPSYFFFSFVGGAAP